MKYRGSAPFQEKESVLTRSRPKAGWRSSHTYTVDMGRGQQSELVTPEKLGLKSGKATRHATIPESGSPFDNETLSVLSASSGKMRTAMRWFEKAHRGVSRKNDSDVPYANHVFGVALIVATSGGSRDDMISALGHDSIEDTSLTYEDIKGEFGTKVADTILALTKGPEFKKIRLEDQAQAIIVKLMAAGPSALRLKGADLLWNMSEIVWDCEERGVDSVRAIFGEARAKRKVEHYLELAELIASQTEDKETYHDLSASLRQRALELRALAKHL